MPTFAAVDVGSNSCRLKIAKVVAHRLKTLAEDREVTRLGASVFESGLVSPEAMALTLRALKLAFFADSTATPPQYNPITIPEKLGATLLMVSTLAVGLYPKMLLDKIEPCVNAILQLK